jgi:hypothetical protein
MEMLRYARPSEEKSFTYNGKFWCRPKDFAYPIEYTHLHSW